MVGECDKRDCVPVYKRKRQTDGDMAHTGAARLVHVPNVQPPLPTDWEVHPTHPVQVVPYHVAQYWDKGLRQRVEEERAARRAAGVAAGGCGFVSRELRNTAKRTPAVAGWVRVLEEPVRQFLLEERDGRAAGAAAPDGGEHDDDEDEEDEDEVVFTGRKQGAAAAPRGGWKRARREIQDRPVDSGVVFDSLGDDDESGAFKRFLTHSISDYYGLASRSATVGRPPRRVVYVGIKPAAAKGPRPPLDLPRPMWELF